MNFSSVLSRLIPKNRNEKKRFLSILLDPHYAGASLWETKEGDNPLLLGQALHHISVDSWEQRIDAVDKAIANIEEEVNVEESTSEAILGLDATYVTPTGDVDSSVRKELKRLCHELSIKPLGYVVTYQAVLHYLKKTEGIPPTVILLSISNHSCTLILCKVGKIVGERSFEFNGRITHGIEDALKSFDDVEILPSRMLLIGGTKEALEDIKQDLLGYPWQQKVGFLHYPKIDILQEKLLFTSIALSGHEDISDDAVENMKNQSGSDEDMLIEEHVPSDAAFTDQENVSDGEKFHEELSHETTITHDDIEDIDTIDKESTTIEEMLNEEKEDTDNLKKHDDSLEQKSVALPDTKKTVNEPIKQDILEDELDVSSIDDEVHKNVSMVNPEQLGFKRNIDVGSFVDSVPNRKKTKIIKENAQDETEPEVGEQSKQTKLFEHFVHMLQNAVQFVFRLFRGSGAIIAVIGIIIGVSAVGWYLYSWVLPRSTIIVYSLPQSIKGTVDITISESVTMFDPKTNTIPAKKNEQIQSGETTVSVTGTKDVGDPSKGSVMLYNKTLEKRTLKKGSILVTGSLEFTIDDDISIASASESIGSITFGKGTASVTASSIGAQGNISAGSEFTVKGLGVSVISGRNDAAFTGGTSRKVTVVSRADQTTLVDTLTAELIEKAKQQLTGSVGGGDVLIDETVKTEVKEKTFQQELNEEASQLSGSITVSISGLSYSKTDSEILAMSEAKKSIPEGYTLDETKIKAVITNIKMEKNRITGIIEYDCIAIPTLDIAGIKTRVAGKTKEETTEYLRSVTGVAGVDYRTTFGLNSSRLPKKESNITITVVTQQ